MIFTPQPAAELDGFHTLVTASCDLVTGRDASTN
ncbi:hypothetical protein SAMN05421757_11082 [Tropicimonas sediminicola]|uniref:Uncharacterized protein n=1 Tax=Tropicimonas sediminicola TaxID=1031541 RepID=A0A239LL97_9RHOB|nr:hypothetical protein SAMN05421757_11082 [Tropicimonas sediminicola]